MLLNNVNAEDLRPGMMLFSWTKQARERHGQFHVLHEGPDGIWQGMVIANHVAEPCKIDGFGYPTVHQIDVLFWNENNCQCFHSFFWTAGTNTAVIE